MSVFQVPPPRPQVIIPSATLAEINRRGAEKSIGTYVSGTNLLYVVRSDSGLRIYKGKVTAAENFKEKDIRMLEIDPASITRKKSSTTAGSSAENESNNFTPVGRDLRDLFADIFGVPQNIADKMSTSDFAKTRFLVSDSSGSLRDLTMMELEAALKSDENSVQIDAIVFPANGVYCGAVSDGGDVRKLLKFMRGENYTGSEFEIYTARGKIAPGNETFKPVVRKFLEKFSTILFAASGAIGAALITEIIAASMAAGVLTLACPPILLILLAIAIGLTAVGAILLFIASRIEHTVPLSPPTNQPQQA
ncbi:MAG: hypothetical protein LBF26_02145 [Puniceicoccales bacterium]|jgi:hypothetical protein|nr:hypothetical protein [Puniceicoccales bacterium]